MLLEMPFNDEDEKQLLAYFRIMASDLKNVTELKNTFHKDIEPLLEDLYKHFFKFPQTASFFTDQTIIDKVKEGQKYHYSMLISGKLDDLFFRHSWEAGQNHDLAGIEPRWYMGCYAYLLSYWLSVVINNIKEKPVEVLSPLIKIACLDISLIWESYYKARAMRLANDRQELERRHKELQGVYNLTIKAMNERAEMMHTYEKEIVELKNKVAELEGKRNP